MGGAAQALLQQSDCVESASEQVGVLGARRRSKSHSKTGSKSSHRPGWQTVGPRVQLPGVKRLTSLSEPPRGESVSPSGERSSDPLPLRQAMDSVSTSVLRQGLVLQEPAHVGRGGHEDASALKMTACRACPSSSPQERLYLSRMPIDRCCLLPMPMEAHRPSVLPVEARPLSLHGHDDLDLDDNVDS